MLFREHRRGLKESMETVREIPATKTALKETINEILSLYGYEITEEKILIDHLTFDERIGWDTYLIYVTDYGIFGFTNSDVK